ncbi:MAK10-like protein [Tanacetum coccineum]|uniref:MAK10-like protein n=1 Tax=Tanacetum coccineum TaxID=301880 RepID=A0ABQ4WM30_9ASTR
MISPAFVEENYEDYDEEREMEPRPEPNREATPTHWPRSPMVRRQREKVVGFKETPDMERSRRGRNAEGIRPTKIEAKDKRVNLPPLLAAHLGRNESGQPLRSSLIFIQGGHQPSTNMGGSLPPNGLHEEQRIFGFVHGLRTRNLVEHLSTDLQSTYKGLMEKTYTWIEAREVATNGTKNAPVFISIFLRDQASNWLERLPAGSISTWEDLTTHFLAQFFPSGMTVKLCNDILMFQQHQGESLSEAWTRFKDLLQKVPHHDIDLWLQVQIFYDHVNPATRRTIDQSAGGKLRDKNAKESWALLEDLALYDNESWNDPRDFAKLVKAISLPQDVPSTSDRRLIKLENQVQPLMEAHLVPKQPIQLNKITSSCEICSGPHDTRYRMENPDHPNLRWRQPQNSQNNFSNPPNGFSQTVHSRTVPSTTILKVLTINQILKDWCPTSWHLKTLDLSKFEADFKQQQSKMTNKIDTVVKAISDRIARALPSDTVKNPKLNVNPTSLVLSAHSHPTVYPHCSTQIHGSINTITICPKWLCESQTGKPGGEEQDEKDNP